MNLDHSQTLQQLINAFTGESLARNKYTFYSKMAKDEGYVQICSIFIETAENEREHAKLFYKLIPNAEQYSITESYPFFFGDTYHNLLAAASAERKEGETIYKTSAQIAKDEGFDEISELFNNIVDIEKRHAHRFETLASLLKEEKLFKKDEVAQWICTKCGHTHIGKEAPCECPVCGHPQGYFELFKENF